MTKQNFVTIAYFRVLSFPFDHFCTSSPTKYTPCLIIGHYYIVVYIKLSRLRNGDVARKRDNKFLNLLMTGGHDMD